MFLAGFGKYLPSLELYNDDFSYLLPTSDEWIRTRTGIRSRRVAAPDEGILEGCVIAAQGALRASGIKPGTLDAIVVATTTSPFAMPSLACLVAGKLEAPPIPAFDLTAACSGFLYGLYVIRGMVAGGLKNVLLLGADYFSWILDYTDRSTCVLFGDGVGAAVVSQARPHAKPHFEVVDVCVKSEGGHGGLLYCKHAYPNLPNDLSKDAFVHMNGQELFKLAVTRLSEAAHDMLNAHGLEPDDVRLVVPHQANLRILKAVASKTGIPMESFWINLERYGNTSAASIPIAMTELQEQGGLERQAAWVLSLACGSGLTWGAALLRS